MQWNTYPLVYVPGKDSRTTDVPAGPSLPKSFLPSSSTQPDPEDNLQSADMDIDGTSMGKQKKKKEKKIVRMAAGKVWEDQSLQEWDPGKCSWTRKFHLSYRPEEGF